MKRVLVGVIIVVEVVVAVVVVSGCSTAATA
jgi:hypothetical protein